VIRNERGDVRFVVDDEHAFAGAERVVHRTRITDASRGRVRGGWRSRWRVVHGQETTRAVAGAATKKRHDIVSVRFAPCSAQVEESSPENSAKN
jgi:hypothetical protein